MNSYPDTLRPGDHLRLAEDFYQAFLDLPPRPPPQSWPRYFMLCHAIELALKAYLAFHGATHKALTERSLRHNLTELLTQATKKGLSLSASAQADINLLQEAHEKYWHRYPKEDGKPVFTIDQFKRPARELLDSVTAALYGGAQSRSGHP
jgi:hypothetical protein